MAIYSEFSHKKWWFSIVVLVYQRVPDRKKTMGCEAKPETPSNFGNAMWFPQQRREVELMACDLCFCVYHIT